MRFESRSAAAPGLPLSINIERPDGAITSVAPPPSTSTT
jgi:hypothetical protein